MTYSCVSGRYACEATPTGEFPTYDSCLSSCYLYRFPLNQCAECGEPTQMTEAVCQNIDGKVDESKCVGQSRRSPAEWACSEPETCYTDISSTSPTSPTSPTEGKRKGETKSSKGWVAILIFFLAIALAVLLIIGVVVGVFVLIKKFSSRRKYDPYANRW